MCVCNDFLLESQCSNSCFTTFRQMLRKHEEGGHEPSTEEDHDALWKCSRTDCPGENGAWSKPELLRRLARLADDEEDMDSPELNVSVQAA